MHARSNPLSEETQEKLNQLIKYWWVGDRTYLALQAACQGDDAMPGFADYFHLLGIRCRVQAELTTKYLTLRGGVLKMDTCGPIEVPQGTRDGMKQFLEKSLEIEETIEQSLKETWAAANETQDIDLMYHIGKKMMRHQTRAIYWALRNITGLETSNSAYLYDRLTMRPLVEKMMRGICAHRHSKWGAMMMQIMSPDERTLMEQEETEVRRCQ
ncbi:unnamed protein product [Schistocephalus solidus]|uniref:Ferritin n=1 Tax=Schistocephalus solidus TaxID=70667 RepID=A0A183SZY1_SCHSO|nr:unnamed protein product [Schistocephalus solidus]